jgi:hypothetical protein
MDFLLETRNGKHYANTMMIIFAVMIINAISWMKYFANSLLLYDINVIV